MNLRQYIKMAFQNLILPLVYRAGCRADIDPELVVFADAHHDGRPDNMELLRDMCVREGLRVEEIYLDYQRNAPGKVLRSMTAFMRLYARAGCVVICDNFLPAAGCRKRPGTRVVQLWHACGSLKKFGYDTTDDIPAGYRGNVFRNTDLVTVSAPWCVPHFASAMRLPEKNVQALGVSRTDRYFDPAWRREARKKFAEAFPEAAGRKIAVWAPTFRGSAGAPKSIPFDAGALEKELGPDWKVISSVHPHMKDGRRVLSTEELFVSCDCLIADYSSLIYEYLLVGRILEEEDDAVRCAARAAGETAVGTPGEPAARTAGETDRRRARGMVLYIPDYAGYAGRRGFYMPYEEIPGTRVKNFRRLAGGIRTEMDRSGSQAAREERQAFLDRYMTACDGKSTERILSWIRS